MANESFGKRARSSGVVLLPLLVGLSTPISATGIVCPIGNPVSADIGDEVIMRTCLWTKEPKVTIRTGPLELIKNGVLILQAQTDSNGRLHGLFRSWTDDGEIMEIGNYIAGLKEGAWIVTDKDGNSTTIYYQGGVTIEP